MKDEIKVEFEKGVEKGIEKGVAKGEMNKAIETAKTLNNMGMDIPFVSQALRVSGDVVRKWLGEEKETVPGCSA